MRYAAPTTQRNLVALTVGAGVTVLIGGGVIRAAYFVSQAARSVACSKALRQWSMALRMYASDYDDHLPASHSWMTQAATYKLRDGSKGSAFPDSATVGACGFAFDERLSESAVASLSHPDRRFLLFETKYPMWNARDSGTTIALRHESPEIGAFANVSFVDGHVGWLDRKNVSAILVGSLPGEP